MDIGPLTFLLSPGDHFFVPEMNKYRLVNYSDTAAEISFVVLKPRGVAT